MAFACSSRAAHAEVITTLSCWAPAQVTISPAVHRLIQFIRADAPAQEVEKRVHSEKPSDRSELLQLCEGMQFVRLPAATTQEVQTLQRFIRHYCIDSTYSNAI